MHGMITWDLTLCSRNLSLRTLVQSVKISLMKQILKVELASRGYTLLTHACFCESSQNVRKLQWKSISVKVVSEETSKVVSKGQLKSNRNLFWEMTLWCIDLHMWYFLDVFKKVKKKSILSVQETVFPTPKQTISKRLNHVRDQLTRAR